ncbi:MAG TPA: hypothetical protein VLB02_03175 [Candidatus Paceibacterota bacterium]|nr:hypothetical protein [Candidatus Paceibacterota bacterium]
MSLFQRGWYPWFVGVLALGAVLFFPFWVQVLAITLVLTTVRPAALALIPALAADLLYSGSAVLWKNFVMTGVVCAALAVYWLLKTKTRIFYAYDSMEKKS